jgi:hypothetical protein
MFNNTGCEENEKRMVSVFLFIYLFIYLFVCFCQLTVFGIMQYQEAEASEWL